MTPIVTRVMLFPDGRVAYAGDSPNPSGADLTFSGLCGTNLRMGSGYETNPVPHHLPEVTLENANAWSGFISNAFFHPVIASIRGVGDVRVGSLRVITNPYTMGTFGHGLNIFVTSAHGAKRGGTIRTYAAASVLVGDKHIDEEKMVYMLSGSCYTTGRTHDKIFLNLFEKFKRVPNAI